MPLAIRVLLFLLPKNRNAMAGVIGLIFLPFVLFYVMISSAISVLHVPAIEPSQMDFYKNAVDAIQKDTGVRTEWQELVAIDAVRFNQDFQKASPTGARRLARKFIRIEKETNEKGEVETHYYKKSLETVVEEMIQDGLLVEGDLQRIKQYLLLPWDTGGVGSLPDGYVPVPSEGGLVFPVVGQWVVTDGFHERINPVTGRYEFHRGIDLAAESGTPVVAARAGKIVFADENGSAGNEVKIDHGDGTKTRYLHLDSIMVRRGQFVEAGELIGSVGSTGRSTGPHLHFEFHVNGRPVDPAFYLFSND
ncbi:M23 family metallopeptidase [Brevibacillus humidisoli]|uniref:M23 family metallopeptidase n=1 Tax=Brevibacillus humidisoli TaxID=2895522 RepID=UPI001E3502AB|nr:M23 family metallopeptidase [Brevibacillus humidisoli]UFJ41353.1 M23 family metallopeptidase [Brevibacillus humidisoli]